MKTLNNFYKIDNKIKVNINHTLILDFTINNVKEDTTDYAD